MNRILENLVARGEKNSERLDLRLTPTLMARLESAAELKGINVSSYIRMAVTERMDIEGVPREPLVKKKTGK